VRAQTKRTASKCDTEDMQIHETETTTVHVLDEPDPNGGGTCHRYEVRDLDGKVLGEFKFQQGAVKEHGANGMTDLDLLAILQHRYDGFQRGPFASASNEVTSGFIASAMASMSTRTRRREFAGVEGRDIAAKGVEDIGS
jgi:hypothetical protein